MKFFCLAVLIRVTVLIEIFVVFLNISVYFFNIITDKLFKQTRPLRYICKQLSQVMKSI